MTHVKGGAPEGGGRSGGAAGSGPPAGTLAPGDTPKARRRSPRLLRRGAAVLLALALAVALLAVVHRAGDLVRGVSLGRVLPSDAPGEPPGSAATRWAALSGAELAPGHAVEVLVDSALLGRFLPDLASARHSITFLGYYCDTGPFGDLLTQLLAERARAGVRVLFLGDDFGCGALLERVRGPLEAAGARVAAFRPVRWHTLHRAQHRMHARSVVIDAAVGYTGGFGIDDKWVSDQPGEPMWRETSVRVEGPAVRAMQAFFLIAWAEATGALEASAQLLPPAAAGAPATAAGAAPAEGVRAGFVVSRPGLGLTPAERLLALSVAGARETLYVTNSYFVPTPLVRRLLVDAARRGVDVRLLLPGDRTDVRTTRWAGRASFDELLSAGVRIFEYQPAMIHAKSLVADGAWVLVGSLNLDNRSLRLNDEAALLAFDEALGAGMDSLFLADLSRSRELTLEAHRARPLHGRIVERLARLVAPLL